MRPSSAAKPSVALAGPSSDPGEARQRAVQERIAAGRKESLTVTLDSPPFLRVVSPSGFAYRVHLRGGTEGPHSCDCPDFEANRLHTCKHVERARRFLRSRRGRLPVSFRREMVRSRVYLHFGDEVEPRLFGKAAWPDAGRLASAFGSDGSPVRAVPREAGELSTWLSGFGRRVEPEALAWLGERVGRRPVLPAGSLARRLPLLHLAPYRYQLEGAEFLARRGRALLADEMGLGKTVQAILAAAILREAVPPVRCVTVVCPASLRGGWQDEIRRWLGEEATLLDGSAEARAGLIASRPRWLITHYEQVLRDHRHHEKHPPDLLIVDEAQRAKGLRTRTARVLKAIGARHLFALTGTPLENRLEEAYAIAQLIDQRLLPPLWQLDRDHFVRDGKGSRVVLYRGLEAFRSRLEPAFLRRRKEDVLPELPARLRSTVLVELHPAVVPTYEDVLAQVARIAGKKVILPAELERMMRLLVIARRCCNGPQMLGLDVDERRVPKLEELREHLKDLCLGEGRKVVIFSEWTDMTDRVEALCGRLRIPVFHLHGGVPVRRRPTLIRAFSEQRGPAAFVSTDAGGLGLNLQAADVVINLDLPWNPARLEQRIARIHRIGAKRPVQELLLVTRESIEERILRLHETKRNVLANVWARKGEDVIAAPGGSGAFREMVDSLLRQAPPAGGPPEPAPAPPATATPALSVPATSPQAPVRAANREEDGRKVPSVAPAYAGQADPGAAGSLPNPEALAVAIAAAAPAVPPEHRRSLAAVFRALAEALEGSPSIAGALSELPSSAAGRAAVGPWREA